MKTYHTQTGLRIVGKGYEVRWQLQKLLASTLQPHAPLTSRLTDWKPGERLPSEASNVVEFPLWRRTAQA